MQRQNRPSASGHLHFPKVLSGVWSPLSRSSFVPSLEGGKTSGCVLGSVLRYHTHSWQSLGCLVSSGVFSACSVLSLAGKLLLGFSGQVCRCCPVMECNRHFVCSSPGSSSLCSLPSGVSWILCRRPCVGTEGACFLAWLGDTWQVLGPSMIRCMWM